VNEYPYQASGSVVLGAGGTGTVTFNGPASLTRRRLSSVVVSTASGARPTVVLYRSSISPNRRIGATRLGDADTLIADGEILESGEPLILSVTGGTAGAVFTANAFGTDLRP
jgi:hypothetical protein